jgi:DNA-binding response OmpR family regulator
VPGDDALTVLLYSHSPDVRTRVRTALGTRPARDLPGLDYEEAETGQSVVERVDRGGVDLLILDGEAWPTGGLGLARQLRDEVAEPPLMLVLIGRRDDAWLASWSRADAALAYPLDAVKLIDVASGLLRRAQERRVAHHS